MSYKKPDYDESYTRRCERVMLIGCALVAVCITGLAGVIVWCLCRL